MVPVVDLPTIPAPPCCKGCAGPAHAAIHLKRDPETKRYT